MAERKRVEPDVTLGELLMLRRLGQIAQEEGAGSPAVRLAGETGMSDTFIRNSLLRIEGALGAVETPPAGRRRTQVPSSRGRSVGEAAHLCDLLIALSRHPGVDQALLQAEIGRAFERITEMAESGRFARPENPQSA